MKCQDTVMKPPCVRTSRKLVRIQTVSLQLSSFYWSTSVGGVWTRYNKIIVKYPHSSHTQEVVEALQVLVAEIR